MNIIALDISKASCGVAIGDASGPPRTFRLSFKQRSRGAVYLAFGLRLRDLIILEKPGLVAAEAASLHMQRGSAHTARLLLGMGTITEFICEWLGVAYTDVEVASWRKAFIGHGRLRGPDAKRAALLLCRTLGWRTDGNHDIAEACGVWAWAHLYRGNQHAMHKMLSVGSLRQMEPVHAA